MPSLRRNPLPGFVPSLGLTLVYLSVLLFLPLGACLLKASSLSVSEFWAAAWSARARAAYLLRHRVNFNMRLRPGLAQVLEAHHARRALVVAYDDSIVRAACVSFFDLAFETARAAVVNHAQPLRAQRFGCNERLHIIT